MNAGDILLILAGFVIIGSFIIQEIDFDFTEKTKKDGERKIQKHRKEWYKKYPPGTKLEIAVWERKCTTQYEMNKNLKEKKCSYYTVVSPQEYFNSPQGGCGVDSKTMQKFYMNNNGILLYCRGENNEFRTITTETLLEIHRGYKEISKVSDVKMKILELKGRESRNEIVKSYSNSRKKNYRKGIKSR